MKKFKLSTFLYSVIFLTWRVDACLVPNIHLALSSDLSGLISAVNTCSIIDNKGVPDQENGKLSAFWGYELVGIDLVQNEATNLREIRVGTFETLFVHDFDDAKLTDDLHVLKNQSPQKRGTYSHGSQVLSIVMGESPYGIYQKGKLASFLFWEDYMSSKAIESTSVGGSVLKKIFENNVELFSASLVVPAATYKELKKNNIISTISAGNTYPATFIQPSSEDTIAVSQISPLGYIHGTSSENMNNVVSAPGQNYSKSANSRKLFGGTSGAQPVVNGCLGFIISNLKGITEDEVRIILKRVAIPDLSIGINNNKNGKGVLNCYKAFRVSDKLKENWPKNREQINLNDLYNYAVESNELLKTANKLLLSPDSCNHKIAFDLARKSYFLKVNQDAKKIVSEIYKKLGYSMNANLWSIKGKLSSKVLENQLIKFSETEHRKAILRMLKEQFPKIFKKYLPNLKASKDDYQNYLAFKFLVEQKDKQAAKSYAIELLNNKNFDEGILYSRDFGRSLHDNLKLTVSEVIDICTKLKETNSAMNFCSNSIWQWKINFNNFQIFISQLKKVNSKHYILPHFKRHLSWTDSFTDDEKNKLLELIDKD